ncbi:MAG: hypothetical protein ACHQHO_13820 [Solirubrobacterales bacterium]
MKQLKILGLALIAIFAFASVVAATASAELGEVKPGLLFLKGVTFPITLKATSGTAVLTSAAGEITCTESKSETSFGNEGEETPAHVTLLNNVTITFTGCTTEKGAVGCRSETSGGVKDPKNTILALVDVHFVALLNSSKELRPGLLFIVLNSPLLINCGALKVEVRGAVGGSVEVEQTEDVSGGKFVLPTALKCDTSDALCKALLEEKPFEANFGGKFEPATQTATATATFSEMVKVDD